MSRRYGKDELPDLDQDAEEILLDYLPEVNSDDEDMAMTPFVTLTYAQLMDSKIAAQPGARTTLSSRETKTITHYLRAQHEAVLVGAGTARSDDPKLTCRWRFTMLTQQPRPVILDPKHTWKYSRLMMKRTYEARMGKAPFIIVSPKHMPLEKEKDELAAHGGKYIVVDHSSNANYYWQEILVSLAKCGIKLLMVEGGARIINDLLLLTWVDSLVVTVCPVFLGERGVSVTPAGAVQLNEVKWWSGRRDLVMCARANKGSLQFM